MVRFSPELDTARSASVMEVCRPQYGCISSRFGGPGSTTSNPISGRSKMATCLCTVHVHISVVLECLNQSWNYNFIFKTLLVSRATAIPRRRRRDQVIRAMTSGPRKGRDRTDTKTILKKEIEWLSQTPSTGSLILLLTVGRKRVKYLGHLWTFLGVPHRPGARTPLVLMMGRHPLTVLRCHSPPLRN